MKFTKTREDDLPTVICENGRASITFVRSTYNDESGQVRPIFTFETDDKEQCEKLLAMGYDCISAKKNHSRRKRGKK